MHQEVSKIRVLHLAGLFHSKPAACTIISLSVRPTGDSAHPQIKPVISDGELPIGSVSAIRLSTRVRCTNMLSFVQTHHMPLYHQVVSE